MAPANGSTSSLSVLSVDIKVWDIMPSLTSSLKKVITAIIILHYRGFLNNLIQTH